MHSFPLGGLCAKGNIRQPGSFDFFKFDMRYLSFISISQVVAIAQLYLWANMRHADVSLGEMSPAVEQYVSRMNLYKLIGIKHNENFTRHMSDDRFVPLSRITDYPDTNVIAGDLVNVVMRRLSVDDSLRDAANHSFGEIMDNIIQHSGSATGGLAAAQYYPTMNYLELCVSDCGRGIASTMAGNPSYLGMEPRELMVKAFEAGCGERVGPQFFGKDGAGMGMGLTFAERFVRSSKGIMWVVSQRESVKVTSSGVKSLDGYWYPGTVIVMRIPTNTGVVIHPQDIFPEREDTGRFSWSIDEGYQAVPDEGGADDLLW